MTNIMPDYLWQITIRTQLKQHQIRSSCLTSRKLKFLFHETKLKNQLTSSVGKLSIIAAWSIKSLAQKTPQLTTPFRHVRQVFPKTENFFVYVCKVSWTKLSSQFNSALVPPLASQIKLHWSLIQQCVIFYTMYALIQIKPRFSF